MTSMMLITTLVACQFVSQTFEPITENIKNKVLVASETSVPVQADLNDINWLEGQWTGSRYSGHTAQHVILDTKINHMPGFVRSRNDDEVWFYEITVFAKKEDSIVYRVKHFGYDFSGWEERDEVIERPLLGMSDTLLQFDGISFERTSSDSFTVYFRISEGANTGDILVIPFIRE